MPALLDHIATTVVTSRQFNYKRKRLITNVTTITEAKMDRPEISNAEWQVMNIIWDTQPTTASEIIKELTKTNAWSPATIRTFLHRLVKKGALKFEEDGNRYKYRAAVKRSSTIKHASRSFLSLVFDGQSGPLLTHFVKDSKLSPEEIQELKQLLEKKEIQK